MEVRETQNYAVVDKYTGQALMNATVASALTATNMVAVTSKGWMDG